MLLGQGAARDVGHRLPAAIPTRRKAGDKDIEARKGPREGLRRVIGSPEPLGSHSQLGGMALELRLAQDQDSAVEVTEGAHHGLRDLHAVLLGVGLHVCHCLPEIRRSVCRSVL